MSEEKLENIVEKTKRFRVFDELIYWTPVYGFAKDIKDHALTGLNCHERTITGRMVFQGVSMSAICVYGGQKLYEIINNLNY